MSRVKIASFQEPKMFWPQKHRSWQVRIQGIWQASLDIFIFPYKFSLPSRARKTKGDQFSNSITGIIRKAYWSEKRLQYDVLLSQQQELNTFLYMSLQQDMS